MQQITYPGALGTDTGYLIFDARYNRDRRIRICTPTESTSCRLFSRLRSPNSLQVRAFDREPALASLFTKLVRRCTDTSS